jgi:hypothetical protein
MTTTKTAALREALAPFDRLSACFGARPEASPRARLDAIGAAEAALERLSSTLLEAKVELEARIARALDEFEADLRAVAQRRGWRLEGGWPTFQIERGVELRVEPKAGLVRVASKTLDVADSGGIEAAIAGLVPALLPKKFTGADFLEQIAHAYDALTGSSSQVAIWDLYARLVIEAQSPRFWREATVDRFAALSPDQFRARLSATMEAGVARTRDGRELRLLPPLDPKHALFVYHPGEQRFAFVGRVEFVAGAAS